MNEDRRSSTEFLPSVEPSSSVDSSWLDELETVLIDEHVGADELLFRAGDPADAV